MILIDLTPGMTYSYSRTMTVNEERSLQIQEEKLKIKKAMRK